jgi:decaprenyl-phosphate phosphoribosyltransferase
MRTGLALVKPRYHLSFAGVALGAVLFAHEPGLTLALRLAALYLSFNVLLYGGIYTFNDIADRAADAAHQMKRRRPIASGRLSVRRAALISVSMILAGLLSGALLFPGPIVLIYAAVLALNAAYSCGGRDLPWLDVALNSAPHPLRFLMGVLLTDRLPPLGHLIAYFCLAAGIACVRRIIELDSAGEGRPVLCAYSARGLSRTADLGLGIVVGLWLLNGDASTGFYAVVTMAYLLFVVCARRVSQGQLGLCWLWLR